MQKILEVLGFTEFTPAKIAAQCFGLATFITAYLIYSRKKRSSILITKLVQDSLWIAHYILLGLWTPAAASSVSVARECVFYNNGKKWASSRVWLFIFLALYLTSAALTWKSVWSIFPALSSCCSTVGFWLKKPRNIRLMSLPAIAFDLTYNIAYGHSPAVYLSLLIMTVSVISALVRDIRTEKAEKNGTETEA